MKKLLTAILALTVCTAFAQKAPADPELANAELQITANKLVKYGYQTKTAMPLIQAVEIYNRLGITGETEPRQKTTVTDAIVEQDTTQKPTVVSFNIEQLIADATKYADGNKNILALIKSLGKTRGRMGPGPRRHYDSVHAYSTDTYTMKFPGGKLAMVIVSGDGDTDLDLYVYDANGNLVGSDTDNTDDCVVSFTPRWTGNFIVKIKNRGRVYNNYVIATN